MIVEIAPCAHRALLVGVAVREQAALAIDDQRETVRADAEAIDEPPQLLQPQLADQMPPSGAPGVTCDAISVVRGSRSSSIGDRRERDAAPSYASGWRQHQRRRRRGGSIATAGRAVEERQLAEIGKVST